MTVLWLVLFLVSVFMLACLALRDYFDARAKSKEPKPKLRQLPAFRQDPRCIKCGGPAGEFPVDVHMVVDLAFGKKIPVTVKLCEACVAQA